MSEFPVEELRAWFPALYRDVGGKTPIYLDGPGGTQVPQPVIDAVGDYLIHCNANHGGDFGTSQQSDLLLQEAHETTADFLNASGPDEVIFGANMTTLTFHLSRSVGRILQPGDEVVVTRLDHDANVRPWVLAARDAGATVRFVDIRLEDCTLDADDLRDKLSSRTRLVAFGAASNVVGTVNDVAALVAMVHEVGAWAFVDAVHYAPHGPIDVRAWDCDFLACSAYKFFGPHVGILYGKRRLLEELTPYKVRPAADTLPDRWMTGTQNHEGIAGVTAALEYLATVGEETGAAGQSTRDRLRHGMESIRAYESGLSRRLLVEFVRRPDFTVWGIADPGRVAERVPTVSVTHARKSPRELSLHLAEREIYAWAGNMYALEVTERLGLEGTGGFLRIGAVHYNTHAEIDRLMEALDEL